MTASITVDTSAIVDGQIIDASDITTPLGQLKTAIEDTLNGIQAFDRIGFGTAEALTISSGVISPTKTHIVVDTEGAAATDNLVTINNGAQGRWVVIRPTSNSRTIVLKHGTGNIRTASGQDYLLSSVDVWAMLIHNGTNWLATIMPTTTAVQINTPRSVVGSGVGSVTISNIPATYKHLLLVIEARTDFAAAGDSILLRFNGDTGSNYDYQFMNDSATTVTAAEGLAAAYILLPFAAIGNTGSAGNGLASVFIYNYASTTMVRGCHIECGSRTGTTTGLLKDARGKGWWRNTAAAISSLTLYPLSGSNIVANSAYTLYGFN